MKKLLLLFALLFTLQSSFAQVGKKVVDETELTTPDGTEIMRLSISPYSGNTNRKITFGNLKTWILTGIPTGPAGSTGQIQFNNAGAFGANSHFTWIAQQFQTQNISGSTTNTYTNNQDGSLFNWSDGTNTATFNNTAKSGNDMQWTYTNSGGIQTGFLIHNGFIRLENNNAGVQTAINFPQDVGTNGQVLTTNGSNQMSWTTVSGSGLSTALNSGNIFVGNGSNIATGVTPTLSGTGGSFALSNAGVYTFPNASTSVRGLVTSTDWNAFNGKFDVPSGTTSQYVRGDGTLATYNDSPFLSSGGSFPNIYTVQSGLPALTSGADNLALGLNTGVALTSGVNNTILGINAGINLNSGSSNVFVGLGAGGGTTTGSNNVMMGLQTLIGLTSGSNNTFLGNGSLTTGNHSNCAAILTSSNHTLAANGELYIDDLLTKWVIRGVTYTMPASGGAAGQALTNNGSQALQWSTIGGGSGTVTSVNSGNFINVDNTDPDNPVIHNTGLWSIASGIGITIDASDPNNPIANFTGVSVDGTTITGDGVVTPLAVPNSPHTVFTPLSGDNISLTDNAYNIINPTPPIATLTVTLPNSPNDGDFVEIKFTQPVTTVTYSSGNSVQDGITSPILGQLVKLVFDSGTSTWY